jgi:predicted alpha/beta superfamily hydrolase
MKWFVILILLLSSVNSFSQELIYTVDTVKIKSKVLNEDRSIFIYKPRNILITDSVKFLYLLEGEYSKNIYQKLCERFKDSISNLIVVGINNPNRRRDMLPINDADKFLDFITSELIPVAEKNYNISVRILNGHSFCGAFTIYALINKPKCFDYYIASSPTPIMNLIKKESYQHIDSVSRNRIVFYFSFGSKDMGQVRKWAKKLNDNLSGIRFRNLDWCFEIFEGKNHGNSDLPGLFSGLKDLKK